MLAIEIIISNSVYVLVSCQAPGCPNLEIRPLSALSNRKLYRGAVLSFECAAGYAIDGWTTLTCNGTHWSSQPPSCRLNQHIDFYVSSSQASVINFASSTVEQVAHMQQRLPTTMWMLATLPNRSQQRSMATVKTVQRLDRCTMTNGIGWWRHV